MRRARIRLKPRSRPLRESAVLLPLLLLDDAAPQLLYIVRQTNLPTHSGQIAFPGGKRETFDLTLEQTALRESHEELGLPADRVEVCGMLDDVSTLELFAITPVVGLVRGPLTLSLSETEVSETFTASLDALVHSYRYAGEVEWSGAKYGMHEFLIPRERGGTHRIWGATARITYQLLALLELLPPLSDSLL